MDDQENDYVRPQVKRHRESTRVLDETIQVVFIRNQRPVADAFHEAARESDAIDVS